MCFVCFFSLNFLDRKLNQISNRLKNKNQSFIISIKVFVGLLLLNISASRKVIMNRTTILFIISILFSLIIFTFYNPSEFLLTISTNDEHNGLFKSNDNSLMTSSTTNNHQRKRKGIFTSDLDLWCQNKSSRCYSPLCYAPTNFLEGGCISNPYF